MTLVMATVALLRDELDALLSSAGVENSRAEARDIIAAVLNVPRFWPNMNPDVWLKKEHWAAARRAAELRQRGAPFAYAVGRAAFRTLTLAVDERVLIPRQETEELIDLVLALRSTGRALDIGTGSGAIAIALATEGRFDRIVATDVSADALAVAQQNVDAHRERSRTPVELRHGSLFEPVRDEQFDLIVSNPPYIATTEREDLPANVRDWEPSLALFSGDDGMTATRAIIAGAPAMLSPAGVLALEVDCRRARLVADAVAATGAFENVDVRLDLSGRERFVLARLDR